MERFIDFSDGKALMVNNADWLMNLNYVEVLRDVGPHFSVNRMLSHECYKQRMERGLTFLEFNYMIMQSYDFYMLYQKYGCTMQFGGDDQWANMLGGTELIRRKLGKDAYAMTITLLLNSEGKKMGKTQSGAVWLDPEKTSPFDFYQYWRNVDDADVIKCMRLLTFLPLEEIDEMAKWEGSQLNKAKYIFLTLLALAISIITVILQSTSYVYYEAQNVYRVYLNGNSLGIIESKKELENYVNKKQEALKEKYNVDNVYIPQGLKIVQEIYNKISNEEDFTINGYTVTITDMKESEKDQKGDTSTQKIKEYLYILDEKILREAVNEVVKSFVNDSEYEDYLNETKKDPKSIGESIQNVYRRIPNSKPRYNR